MNIAVVDDEKAIQEQIKEMVFRQKPGYTADAYDSGDSLLAAVKLYDVIFLDIQMEGRNGIDTARELRKRQEDFVIIFITGIKDYVFEAFDVAAFHYLLKPVEEKKLREVFLRAVKEAEKRRTLKQKTIFIKTKSRSYAIEQANILYVESRRKKAEIHTTTEIIEIYAAMGDLEKELGEGFYRCHRGYLVNMAHITEYDNERIALSNGENVYMARERYNEFVRKYMRYLRSGGAFGA